MKPKRLLLKPTETSYQEADEEKLDLADFKRLEITHFGSGGGESTDFGAMKELGVHFKRIGGGIGREISKNLEN